ASAGRGGGGGSVLPTATSTAGPVEGERRRDAALQLLRAHRAILVRRGQRALLTLLQHGAQTTDAGRSLVPIPAATEPRPVGSAVIVNSYEIRTRISEKTP